jgi:hypothetical protein
MSLDLPFLIRLAGFGQIALAMGSLAIPKVLSWREETAKLRPLTRQIFWTYAGYIFFTNLSFGLLSAAGPRWLADGSPLAAAVTGFIAVYWAARLLIQFLCLDRRDAPRGSFFIAAEVVLVTLFVCFTAVYACAAVENLRILGGSEA